MRAIDLFAGAGGFSTGAAQAGAQVIWAANHWPVAVQAHSANHPQTEHACQDLHQANWLQVPSHDLLLASPSCTGHTRARGKDRPHHDAARSTAWAVVSCAEAHRPAFCVVENVSEFQQWALYPAWAAAMQALGYSLSPHIVDAAYHGVPQHRKRLFLVAARSRSPLTLKLPRHPHAAIGRFLQWDHPDWAPVHRPGRARATLDRIANARRRFGERFVMPYYGSGSGLTGRGIDRPIGTVTTRDRWAVVDGDRMRMFTVEEYRHSMGFPERYFLADTRQLSIFLLGNAVCPSVARDIVGALKAAA